MKGEEKQVLAEIVVKVVLFLGAVMFIGWIWLSNKAETEEWGKEVELPELAYRIGDESTNWELVRVIDEDEVLTVYLPDMNKWDNYNPDTGDWHLGLLESDHTSAITFWVKNEGAKLKKADLSLEFWVHDHLSKEMDNWDEKLIITFSEPWQYGTLDGEVIARNTAGETRKRLKVTKAHMDEACAELDPDNETETCQGKLKRESEVAEEKNRKQEWQARQEQMKNLPVDNSVPSCLHEEEGKCWDEVEEAGYEDGMYDGMLEMHGLNYFDTLPEEFGECADLCEEIYEDAYEEGYVDGQTELKRKNDF